MLTGAAAVRTQAGFAADAISHGRDQLHRTGSHCHGFNRVKSGTTVYGLQRFPVDDPDRISNPDTNSKGNRPSFKDALSPEQIQLRCGDVGSRCGKEP